MKVIIIGAGKIGSYLARDLCREGHDVTVVDILAERLRDLSGNLDVICVEGNGADCELMQELDVADTDILIAATGSDDRNLICCLAARQLGAKHTVARIREPVYLNQTELLKQGVGLYMAFSPDREAASEIARLLEFPSAARVETFSNGRIELVEYRLPPKSELDGLPLSQLYSKYRARVLICAVVHGGQVTIPRGDFVLHADDVINVAGERVELRAFFKATGAYKNPARTVMILGGSRIAVLLARQMAKAGIQVTIIEKDPARADELYSLTPKARIVCGDGTRPDVLQEEGLRETDAFVALTGSDENNIITSMYAKQSGISKVITKINEEHLVSMLSGSELDCFIIPKQLVAHRIAGSARALFQSQGSSVENLYRLVDGQVEALEFAVDQDFKSIGTPLREMHIRPGVLVAATFRNGHVNIANGDTCLQAGDRTVVVTTKGGLSSLDAFLEG